MELEALENAVKALKGKYNILAMVTTKGGSAEAPPEQLRLFITGNDKETLYALGCIIGHCEKVMRNDMGKERAREFLHLIVDAVINEEEPPAGQC